MFCILRISLSMLLYCNVYAGQILNPITAQSARQEINPTAISLYQLCIRELAEPGTDNRYLPYAIQCDTYPLQVERFAEYSRIYEEMRGRARQEEASNRKIDPYSTITKEAIAFAYRHFPDADVSCATEIARGYVSIPEAVSASCNVQVLCYAVMGVPPLVTGLLDLHPCLSAKLVLTFWSATLCSSCGFLLCVSSHMCLKKQCLDAALPHYSAPKTMRMHLEIPDSSLVQREEFPVDEDISEEEAAYDEEAPLL